MSSIRRQLLAGLIGAVIAAGALAAFGVYFQARREAGELLDYHLRQMALSLRDQTFKGLDAVDAAPYDDFAFAIEVRSADGAQLHYSRSAAHVRFPELVAPGYATIDTSSGLWRAYTLQQGGLTLRVAQPVRVRDALAAQVARRTLMPFLLLVPLLGALVWLLVARGLRPLETVANAVRARTPAMLQPLVHDGLPQEIEPVVSSLNDLLARLRRALEMQQAFVADAAHELRTPLTALRLQVQLAERAADDGERTAAFETVKQGLARATHLVEGLLTLAREEPDTGKRTVSDVDIAQLARQVVGDYAPMAENRRVDLGMAYSGAGVFVRGEAQALGTLLSNLVDNAVRYTPAGGRVDVSVARADGKAVIEVADTGPGIPKEERELVFHRFYRRANGDATGSGLGLAIVRSIAQRHGARVTLDAPPGGHGLLARVTFDT